MVMKMMDDEKVMTTAEQTRRKIQQRGRYNKDEMAAAEIMAIEDSRDNDEEKTATAETIVRGHGNKEEEM